MEIRNAGIDGGNPFDWGRTSGDYAKYRDIYPPEFYRHITDMGLCVKGQRVLDIGTGTGVLPRNLYAAGADWVGTDISPEQIEQAKALAASGGMQIDFRACPAEQLDFPPHSFDTVTACQCFWYFDHAVLTPILHRLLKADGHLLVLQLEWLPFEDELAMASEQLVLRFNPKWSGAGETRHPVVIADEVLEGFTLTKHEEFALPVHFTRERWHGRMRACRGVGASLSPEALSEWETAHREMLEQKAPPEFDILHYAAMAVLQPK